jgi:hypothetical protein
MIVLSKKRRLAGVREAHTVAQDVELCGRPTVPDPDSATHEHELLHAWKEIWVDGHEQRDVGHRA